MLSAYLAGRPLAFEQEGRTWPNVRKLSELPYHQAMAGEGQALTDTLMSLPVMSLSLSGFRAVCPDRPVQMDRDPFLEIAAADKEALALLRDALELSSHILVRDRPSSPLSSAGGCTPLISRRSKAPGSGVRELGDAPHLRPLKVQFTAPGGGLSFTMKGDIHGGGVVHHPAERPRL